MKRAAVSTNVQIVSIVVAFLIGLGVMYAAAPSIVGASTTTVTSTSTVVSNTTVTVPSGTGTTSSTSSSSTSGSTSASKVFKIAYISTNSGPTYSYDQTQIAGLLAAAAALNGSSLVNNDIFKVTYVWSVQTGDYQSVAASYAQQGYNLIIPSNSAYESATYTVASQYPNVQFFGVVFTGNLSSNVGTMTGDYWQIEYFSGIVAGLMTQTNKLGFVTAFQFPPVVEGINAFIAGAKLVNPNVTVYYAFSGDWSDPVKGTAAANTLIADGVDIVAGMGDGQTNGVIQAAQSAGIKAIGYLGDENSLAPNTVITSTVWNTTAYYYKALQAAVHGTLGHQTYTLHLYPDHIGQLAPYHGLVPNATATKIAGYIQQVDSGQIKVPENTTLPANPS